MKLISTSSHCGQRNHAILRRIAASSLIAAWAWGGAVAQTALDGANFILPLGAPSNVHLTVGKTKVAASANQYRIVVKYAGAAALSGVRINDEVGSGEFCPPQNPVAIAGDGAPPGIFTIGELSGAGIVLATLNSGQTATITYSCQGN